MNVSSLPVELCHEFLLFLNGKYIFNIENIFKLPKELTENEYFWRLKFKADKLQPLKPHQYSEDYENYQKKFRCTEKAYYTYLFKLRQNWLTKSWNDALNPIASKPRQPFLIYVDERIIVKTMFFNRYEIINSTTNQVISKFRTSKHNTNQLRARFPFVFSYDWHHNEVYVWNAEEHKLMWKHRYSRTLEGWNVFCVNDNLIGTLTNDVTQISLIDMTSGIVKANLPNVTEIYKAHFCNKFLIVVGTNPGKRLNVWNIDNLTLKYSIDIDFCEFLNDDDAYVILLEKNNIYSKVLNLEEETIHTFETNLDYAFRLEMNDIVPTNNKLNIVLRKPKVIFFDLDNSLKVVDYTTRACIAERKYDIEIDRITANSNFIFVKTLKDIRIVDLETCRELRIFAPNKTVYGLQIKTEPLTFFRALESKLILEYHLENEKAVEGRSCQFTLDFNV